MSDASFEMPPPEALARLLDLDGEACWSAADASAALVHQLQSPLLPDLLAAPGAERERLERHQIGGVSLDRATFLAALTDPRSAPEVVQAIKGWAKCIRVMTAHPLAGGPATVLYFAAIAAATDSAALARVTGLSREDVCAGYRWALEQPGTEALRGLFERALKELEKDG